ncbi:S-adenosyl-L-methionine-dependent methyltransferase, partial [Melampsora americana]
IFILLIYQSIPSSQSLCKDEPTDYTKTQTNLISRRLSKTGLISVGEFRDLQSNEVFRYLRSDHSILGGIWIGPALNSIQTQFHQNHFNQTQLQLHALQISESIYSTFIIQQAIRLVIRNQSDHQSPPEALIIGLGIGISAKSLMNHSIKTTVVEIDPIVYQYALTHFGFDPPNGGIFLEDIQLFLNRSESENLIDRFDYVIHDVFTGGMVPPQLFVKPFWISLKKVLKSDGVLVINFAGIPTSQAGLMILFTIFDVFENCRTFSEEENEETNENLEFQNLVIFCKMNESPKFRKVTRSDVFNSSHQFWILNRFLQHEITFRISRILNSDSFQSKKKEFILEGRMDWIKLRGNLMESALEHWKVMRTVLDRKTWENYY